MLTLLPNTGSASALHMMWSPLSRGLIHGVIPESGARGPQDPLTGSVATSYRNKTHAETQGVDFLATMNVTTIAQLRNVSISTLLTANNDADTTFVGTAFENQTDTFMEPPVWRPVVDGYVLTRGYGEALALNDHADVPILTGNNKDESGANPDPNISPSRYAQYGEMFGNLSSDFFALYPNADNSTATASNSSNHFYRDLSRVSTWNWARDWIQGGAQSDVFVYFFTTAPAENREGGAYHGSELWYTFNNIPYASYSNVTWTAEDYVVERQMSEYWVNFISTGNPNGRGKGAGGGNLTYFPASSVEEKQVMYLGDSFGAQPLTPTEGKFEFLQEWMGGLVEY